MSVNLLDLAKTALGSGAFGNLAGSLGESEEKTKSAFDLAGSAILGSLMKKMSNPQGSKDVFNEVSRFDTGMLDNITDVLTGGGSKENASALTSLGGKLLSSMLGSNQDSIIGMIAKLAGIGQGSSKSLLTMIAPLLLGTIAKQVKSGGLNLEGLTKLVMGQKSVVSKNLPAEFSKSLGIANLLDDGAKAVQRGSQQAKRAATENAIADAADQVGDAAERITAAKPAIPGVDIDAITRELTTNFGSITESISGITDEASAQQAVPQIENLAKQIGQYGFDKMPQEASSALQGVLQPLIEKLQAAIETVSQIPGVKAILQPAVEMLTQSVAAFTKS